ncbi:LAME_0D09186g1_1 [Lachancea meyersii CBS 8951]|uniref:Aminopeptidase n=1 Tax=Lachancea meyersii CBS 8951 TaxID=1266667 RepID=A0A1G4JB79_9SACH|nr:LAME_0D09186g1_1 [Lachancea meyersii CBS 8951]
MSDGNQTLPDHFRPLHYSIELDCSKLQDDSFSGSVSITFQVNQKSNKVFLNIKDLKVLDANIVAKNGSSIALSSQTYDGTTDVAILTFAEELAQDFTLNIAYEGAIQTNMTGFYKSEYLDPETGEKKVMHSSQFEATDARKAFPCLDEPAHKATFDVTITAASHLTVLSNMPLKSSTSLENGAKTVHTFRRSPKMSTYLVAWALGEYDYIEKHTEKCIYPCDGKEGSQQVQKLPVRVYTAKGKSHQGQFALDVACRVIDYYSDLFGIPYPIPKLDLLCVEAYSHNAMENFSLITFRPTALLLEGPVEASSPLSLQKIAYVVCHEIAHQWFGNLVTMKWWDELWLNEGFATWIGYYAVNWMFPEWDVPSLVMWKSHEVALELDSLKESHPVKVSVKNAKDIDQLFDTISYLKGCSLLEMISEFLGSAYFIRGVALYLKRNAFSNATMDDLLDSAGEVCKIDVRSRLNNWILRTGYPLLVVDEESTGRLKLSQEGISLGVDPCTWWIPLMSSKGSSGEKLELSENSLSLEYPTDELVHLNANGFGFYRVEYRSASLLSKICANLEKLSSRGKIALVSDVQTTASAAVLLDVLGYFTKIQDPYDYYVWAVVFESCSRLLLLLDTSSNLYGKVKSFIKLAIEPQVSDALSFLRDPDSLLMSYADKRRALKAQFYEQILLMAGEVCHEQVVEQCVSHFRSKKSSPVTRQIVMSVVLSQPETSLETFDAVVEELKTATLAHKEGLLAALGKVRNPLLFAKTFDLIFQVQTMDVQFLAEAMGKNADIRCALWSFIKSSYEKIHARIGSNPTVLERFVRFSLSNMIGSSLKLEIEQFFADKDVSNYDRALKQTLEKIGKSTQYAEANV